MHNRIMGFDGDYVKRVEFVPKENLDEIKSRIKSFNLVDSQKGAKEYDFRPFSILLDTKNISVNDVRSAARNVLVPYDGVVLSEVAEDTLEGDKFAFGDEYLVLWGGKADTASDKLTWLEFVQLSPTKMLMKDDKIKLQILSQMIFLIGAKQGLLLVDLDSRKIVDCSMIEEISEYFRSW